MQQRSMSGQTDNPQQGTRPLPDPTKLYMTRGVQAWATPRIHLTYLAGRVQEAYQQQPDTVLDGGNDKFFFSLAIYDQRFFVAANEVGGLTIMLPEEY
jgi:hypothetical protein